MRFAWRPGSTSLATKLALTTSAALLTAAAMTALVVLTVINSARMAETAELANERVRIYGELQTAARDYREASFLVEREPGAASTAAFDGALQTFQDTIEQTAQMRVESLDDRETRARITNLARVVVDLFREPGPLVERVDAVWARLGTRAALREATRVDAPIATLDETLDGAIDTGRNDLERAMGRGTMFNRIAVLASVFGLGGTLAFLLLVQPLLQGRLRPGLAQLERGARQFGQGNLDHRIALGGNDELAGLGRAFDTMAEALADERQTLRRTQAGLEMAVAERTRELQRANAELSREDGRRRAFLANIGHELRTPLTIIRGEAEVALRQLNESSDPAQESFECILEQTLGLGRMVDDMFLIARAEAGALPLDRVRIDLAELTSRIASDFDTLVSEAGGSIKALIEQEVTVIGDRDRLRRALTALVENALHHCQAGVRITIHVRTEDGQAIVAVEDDGPGIDQKIIPLVFERYTRGNTPSEGTGLGLNLVRALVMAHSGRVKIENVEPHGTRVVIALAAVQEGKVAA